MIGYLQKKAGSMPYNAGSGHPDAHNGMEFEGEEMTLEASVSRKHFQQVADLLKNIPDEAKRKEMAMHHAVIFKQQNPRFDIARFGQAAGVDLSECSMYEELKGGQKKLDINGDGKLGANDFAALRHGAEVDESGYINPGLEALAAKKRAEREAKQKQTDEGYGEMDAYLKDLEKQKGTGKFDSRKTSTGTVYTRKPETFASDDEGSEPTPARGRGRPAVAKKAERVTKGAWKRKEGMQEHGSGVENMKGKSWQSSKAGAHPWNEDEEINEKAEAGKREFFDKLAPAAKKVAKVVNKMTKGKEK
jgi:hypothetical protein